MLWSRTKPEMVTAETALPGRDRPPFEINGVHAISGHQIVPPFPDGHEVAVFALGCFWGAERLFWSIPGVWSTAVGYAGGFTANPTYEETCSGRTGHTESVLVAYDPAVVPYRRLLEVFFNEHDPTQENRQGNDVGTQYRSAIYWTTEEQRAEVESAVEAYGRALAAAGKGPVMTELAPAGPFYFAEEYHQQYLHKVPNGYCGLKGTGVTCALSPPAAAAADQPRPTDHPDPTGASPTGASPTPQSSEDPVTDPKLKSIPASDDEWRERLDPARFDVLRRAGTERAFVGAYTDTEDPGLYRCAACGNPLFTSDTKFHSGSGWPSFTEALSPEAVEVVEDRSHGMVRTEVRCARCHSHLGHVFPDGPPDRGGQRFCLNSLALDLEPEST
ncbi:MAG: Peptide methionine sulfoxide reductase MsrA [Acidimicrobiales bacterium]|nr:Peptide methionine sulfoxide reductase MsrA [Acidimicrobiales bacterium]